MDNDSINVDIQDSEVRRRKTKKKKSSSFSPGSISEKIAEIQIKGRKMGTVDLPFFFIVAILIVFGIIMMFSASYAWAISEGYPGIYYARRQIIFALGGLAAMFITSRIDYHFFQKKTVAVGIFAVAFILMILVLTPLGRAHGNARRWLYVGIEFQPSEIMKFAIVTLFSLMLTNNRKRIKSFKKGVLPFVFILLLVTFLLMKQPHLSCTIIICIISVILLFVGGVKVFHLLGVASGGVLGLAAVVLYKMRIEGFSYFEKRFRSWKDPFSDISGDTWQTYQSLVAIGSGGFFGMGLGNSRQKFQYLPETKNDFVFSIVCEELGFVGAATVVALFAFFVFRGFYIASKAPDKFGMLMCIGLTSQIGFQAFLNIAVVSNFIPNTGISLPFFSYGGSALMMLLAQVGIILNISRQALMDAPDETPDRVARRKRAVKAVSKK